MRITLYIAAAAGLAAVTILIGGMSIIGACLLGGIGFSAILAWIAHS